MLTSVLLAVLPAVVSQQPPVQVVVDANPTQLPTPTAPLDPFATAAFEDGVLAFGAAEEGGPLKLWFARPDVPAIELPVVAQNSNVGRIATLPGKPALVGAKAPVVPFQMWQTDGSPSGTIELTVPGHGGSFEVIRGPIAAVGRYWWTTNYLNQLVYLWSSDGTQESIQLEAAYNPGNVFLLGDHWLYPTSTHVFLASRFQGDSRFASIAGTGEPLVDLGPLTDANFNPVEQAHAVGDELWFAAEGPEGAGAELWVSDGTPLGTRLVRELIQGPADGEIRFIAGTPGGIVFFATGLLDEIVEGAWFSDGTDEGTVLLAELTPSVILTNTLSEGLGATLPDGRVAFDDFGGELVWIADGTPEGTVPLGTPAVGLPAKEFLATDGKVYFASFGSLWVTDGTEEGTVRLLGPGVSTVELTAAAGGVVFSNGDLWFSSGTEGSTGSLFEAPAGPATESGLKLLVDFERAGDRMYFAGHTELDDFGDLANRELWVTDGTAAGSSRVIDLVPGPESGLERIQIEVAGRLVFTGPGAGEGLEFWVTDGSEAETEVLIEELPVPGDGDTKIYGAGAGAWAATGAGDIFGDTLFFTNGAPPSVENITPADWTNEQVLDGELLGGRLLMRTLSPGSPHEDFWTSDGTATGTQRLGFPPFAGLGDSPRYLTRFGSFIYYTAYGGSGVGRELYRTDFSPSGTGLFLELEPGPGDGLQGAIMRAGEHLYLQASTTSAPDGSLYLSDGTVGGTVPLASLAPGFPSFDPESMAPVGDRLAFLDQSSPGSPKLWLTDGTIAGTRIMPNPGGVTGFFVPSLAAGKILQLGNSDQIVFEGDSSQFGRELWRYAPGSPPVRLTDLMPGEEDSDPYLIGELNGLLLFGANDPLYGRELLSIRLADLGLAGGEPFGTACSFGQPPVIDVEGEALLGAALTLELADAAPGSVALAFYGLGGETVPFGPGCAIYMGDPRLLGSALTDGEGRAALGLSLPGEPALVGTDLTVQWLVEESAGPVLGAFATSGAFELVIAP